MSVQDLGSCAAASRAGAGAPPDTRRLRVMTLIDALSLYGGAERLAFEIAARLDAARFESMMCITYWPPSGEMLRSADDASRMLRDRGVRLFGLPRRGSRDVWAWLVLIRILRHERIDVLHAHKFGSNLWGVLTGRAAGVPVVLAHEHSWSYQGKPLRRFLDREVIARGADRLIAVSRADRRRMTTVEGISAARTVFVPNGIPPAAPSRGGDVRTELGIAREAPVIGSVGSLYPVKAFDVLLRAVALLRRDRPDVQLLIAGTGPEREHLEAVGRELSLNGSLHMLGRREDVPDVLAALDVAVCCSLSEGSPLSVMEYMRAGLPVVGSSVGGVPDLIEPGVNGMLVPVRDPSALASALDEILTEPGRAREMGARGAERQRAEFDIDVFVRRLEALYTERFEAHSAG